MRLHLLAANIDCLSRAKGNISVPQAVYRAFMISRSKVNTQQVNNTLIALFQIPGLPKFLFCPYEVNVVHAIEFSIEHATFFSKFG